MTQLELPCKLGDRIECNGSFGTVKYIGEVDGKPGNWLGIDWDDLDRGKHNGTINKKHYFTAINSTSGSFVRPGNVNFGKSALASIEARYGQGEDEFTAKIHQQKHLLIQQDMNAPFLEMVGFDKVFNKQSNLSSLRIVNLRNQNVNSAGPCFKLGEICPNIEELDISKNLLVSWKDIFELCDQLPKLFWLNVSQNHMIFPENFDNYKYKNIKTMICGSMKLTWNCVCKIGYLFPNIEEMRVPNNYIENLDTPCNILTNLKLLDLEGNNIQLWSEVCKLGHLQTLDQLIIENTGLSKIEFPETDSKVAAFRNLRKICLTKNLLNEWRSIGELNRLQNLEHLKISKNPITESENHKIVYQILIARISNLKILNGVEIEASERKGAEYDYIKKYGLEWLKVKNTDQKDDFLNVHNRYLELLEKYGEPEESELLIKPKMIKNDLIKLKLHYRDQQREKWLPPTMTVQKLGVLVQKLFRIDERPDLLYKSSTEAHIEILLDDELKEIGFYSVQNDDNIVIS